MATTSAKQVRGRGAVVGRDADRREGEHRVRGDRSGDAAGHLGRDVGEGVAPAQAAEAGVDERDDRVEVGAGDRPEHEDDREEAGRGRGGVLEQLQADVAGRELGGGDARPDHGGGEKRRAEELGEQAARQRGIGHQATSSSSQVAARRHSRVRRCAQGEDVAADRHVVVVRQHRVGARADLLGRALPLELRDQRRQKLGRAGPRARSGRRGSRRPG